MKSSRPPAKVAPAGPSSPLGPAVDRARDVPDATIARLPGYLRALQPLTVQGVDTCSSEQLAQAIGVRSATLRKDLSALGYSGRRGVGYDVERLRARIVDLLGESDCPVLVVADGPIGSALADWPGLDTRGFRVVATLAPEQVDTEDLERLDVALAVVATEPEEAQRTAERLVAAGVTSLLDVSGAVRSVPEHVALRRVDLPSELQILAYHRRRSTSPSGEAGPSRWEETA